MQSNSQLIRAAIDALLEVNPQLAEELTALEQSARYDEQRTASDAEKHAQLMNTGRCAYEAIVEMVAALECDYDRLEELRSDRDAWHERYKEGNEQCTWDEGALDADELKELEDAAGECESRDDAEQRIHEDPLSIEVRGDWHTYGDQENLNEPTEFRVLLSTGGPAVRIVGELDGSGEPSSARLEVQDWFTPWTEYLDADQETLLTYCRCFYFGE